MSINEEKLEKWCKQLEMWCNQVDRRLDKLEGKNCKPKEPYIGDEETAEFVRAWAKHWGIEKLRAYTVGQGILTLGSWPASSAEYEKDIDIQAAFVTGDVEDGGLYTIDELCGEEEE